MKRIKIQSFRNHISLLILGFIVSAIIAFIVYQVGGTQMVYTNLMYLPIAFVSSIYGYRWGFVHAFFSGFLIGPLMPLVVSQGIFQDPINWTIRILIYIAISFIIGIFADLANKRERHITFLVTHDSETGLKNYEALRGEINLTERPVSFISLSVINYVEFLGFFGYDFFQLIIRKFSENLQKTLKPFPEAELYRYYGLEFAIKIIHEDEEANTEKMLAALNKLNESNILIEGIPVYIEFHIGIANLDISKVSIDGMRKSIVALRYAVNNNLRLVRYTDEMESSHKSTVSIASGFRNALAKGQIRAAYQTIHSSSTGEVQGMELLARWIKEDGSRISPDVFVQVLEKTELIHDLTDFMVDCGLALAANPEYSNWFISINFSSADFSEKCMLNLVKKIHKYKVSPSRLHIEITERILLCVSNIRSHLDFLRRHGLTIVIDDFGTGYSSYSYVADFPIDVIKIDRSLILKANTPKGFGLIKSIVSFCGEFQIKTVAEGVEDKECADICEALGIDLQQGYFYSHPELVPLTPVQS